MLKTRNRLSRILTLSDRSLRDSREQTIYYTFIHFHLCSLCQLRPGGAIGLSGYVRLECNLFWTAPLRLWLFCCLIGLNLPIELSSLGGGSWGPEHTVQAWSAQINKSLKGYSRRMFRILLSTFFYQLKEYNLLWWNSTCHTTQEMKKLVIEEGRKRGKRERSLWWKK